MKKLMILLAVGTVLASGFTSCKKDDDDAKGNTFKVRMTDGPGDYVQLNVQVTSVDVYSSSQGWVNLSSQTQSINVLSLTNGAEMELASSTQVTAGTYTKLRITFASQASIQLVGGGAAISLNWTGGTQQVEIVINEQVSASSGANLLVDFNVAQSVSEVGGVFNLNPIITVIADENTGVKGKVQGASSVMVKLQNGSHSYSTYINAQGNFLLRGMESGTYTAYFMASGSLTAHEVDNVTVTQGQITGMGTIDL